MNDKLLPKWSRLCLFPF